MASLLLEAGEESVNVQGACKRHTTGDKKPEKSATVIKLTTKLVASSKIVLKVKLCLSCQHFTATACTGTVGHVCPTLTSKPKDWW